MIKQRSLEVATICVTLLFSVDAGAQTSTTVEKHSSGYTVVITSPTTVSRLRFPSASGIVEAFRENGRTDRVFWVLGKPELFGQATVDTVAGGLEALATMAPTERTRLSAASILGFHAALPGMTARLIRVYGRSRDRTVRWSTLQLLAKAGDRRAALEFVRAVAARPMLEHDAPETPLMALCILSRWGPEGRAALADLHTRRAVQDPHARESLQRIASHGYSCESTR
jgi:HEAT repeat protein